MLFLHLFFQLGIPLTDSYYLSKITLYDVKSILMGDKGSGEIPLIHERLKNLNEIGQVLIDKYNGENYFFELAYSRIIFFNLHSTYIF